MPSETAGATGRQPQDWLLARARLMPNLLAQSPPWVRGVFRNAWAPMRALAEQVRLLPEALWDYMQACEGGFVVITNGESRYVYGETAIRELRVQNAAHVSVMDLAEGNEQPLYTLGCMIDHYLGCGGAADGAWLSEGGGVMRRWRQEGERLPRLFALGYGVDEVARADVRSYFAQSLAIYCRDRRRVNVADPQIDKWFRSTLWSDGFWRFAQ